MKKVIFFVLFIFILGGCDNMENQEDITSMDPSDLPDVRAFQDEHTREFMASTKEVEEGYYLFQSKTGGYTMMYPENAKMDHIAYEKHGNTFELIKFADSDKKNDIPFYVQAIYDFSENTKSTDTYLKMLSRRNGYEGDFDRTELQDKDIYFATDKYITKDKERSYYIFLVFVKSKSSNQAVRYTYNVICYDEKTGCSYDLDAIEKEVKNIMNSITFTAPED